MPFVLPGGKIVVFTGAHTGALLPTTRHIELLAMVCLASDTAGMYRHGSILTAKPMRAGKQHIAQPANHACAACTPGLIKLLDRDEDLLAAVLGHEVAHALARHSSEKLT